MAGLDFEQQWKIVLNDLEKEKTAYRELFSDCSAYYNKQSNILTIEFPQKSNFAFKAIQRPETQMVLSTAIHGVFGDETSYEITKI